MKLRFQALGCWLRHLPEVPELNVIGFAFLLTLPWELWMSVSSLRQDFHGPTPVEVAAMSTLASLGHTAITLLGFWVVAGAAAPAPGRGWIRKPNVGGLVLFALAVLGFTVLVEALATGIFTNWQHATSLPSFIIPGLELASLLQVIAVPVLTAWIVSRQLNGTARRSRMPQRSKT